MTIVLLARSGQYAPRRRLSRIDDGIGLVKALLFAVVVVLGLAVLTKGFGTGFTNYSRKVLLLVRGGAVRPHGRRPPGRCRPGSSACSGAGRGCAGCSSPVPAPRPPRSSAFSPTRPWLGFGVVGYIAVLDEATEADFAGGLPRAGRVLGGIAQLPAALQATGAGEVVVALDRDEHARFPELVAALHAAAVPFRVMPDMFEQGYRSAQDAGMDGLATVRCPWTPWTTRSARSSAPATSSSPAPSSSLLSPFLLAVALAIVLTSRGGPFYSQSRVGEHGRAFRMYKFRTMYRDADRRRAELQLREAAATRRSFKIKDDPRITPVGRLLRRWSVDELPQFFNVLKGDMSVVGPRPSLPGEVEAYDTAHLGAAQGQARHHRPLAGERPQRPALREDGRPGHVLPRELVAGARPQHRAAHRARRGARQGRILRDEGRPGAAGAVS